MHNTTYPNVARKKIPQTMRWFHFLFLYFLCFIGPVAFAQFPAPYCEVDGYDVEEITKVKFGTLEIVNTNDTALLVNRIADVATATIGQPYTITVEGNTYGMTNEFLVFIDWNQNGSFTDAGEVYYMGAIDDSDGEDGLNASLAITIPANALTGQTRIRVTKTWTMPELDVTLNRDPCFISYYDSDIEEVDSSFGQALDFTLNVGTGTTDPGQGGDCEIEINLTFPEYGDMTTWRLLDGSGTAVLSGGPYSYLQYNDFSIQQTYTAANPPYSLQITIDDTWAWGCDNEVQYAVSVGGVEDISGTVLACLDLVSETHPIGDCPTGCSRPSRLRATEVSPNGFTLAWTSSGEQFEIEWGLSGFVQGSADGTLIENVTTTSYVFADLDQTEVYQFYVRAICTDDEVSAWTGPFTYDEMLVTPSPWHEDFEAVDAYPLGWRPVANSNWEFNQVTPENGTSIQTELYDYSFLGGVRTAGFSTITVGPILNGDTFSFKYLYENPMTGGPVSANSGNIVVEFSTNYGATYTRIQTLTNNGASGWQDFSYDLDNFAGEYLTIKITANVTAIFLEYLISLDDFDISGGVPCYAVTGADVDGNDQETVLYIESEGTVFEIEYGVAGFQRGQGRTVTNVSTPYTFTDLVADTNYEVYIRTMPCGEWYGPVSFTTAQAIAQTITVDDVVKAYGDLPFIHGESDSGLALSYSTDNTSVAIVQNGQLVIKGAGETQVTASQLGNLRYLPAEDVSFTLTVTKANLTVTANANQFKPFGDEDPVFSYTASGFKYTDDQRVFSGALSRESGESIATYAITQGTLTAGTNYEIVFVTADFAIVGTELRVIAQQQSKEYGAVDPVLTYTVEGLKQGDTVADVLTGELNRMAGENVGNYTITQGNLLLINGNYRLVYLESELTITSATLTVHPTTGMRKVYGEADPVFGFTVTGFKFADTQETTVLGLLGRSIGENVGLYRYTLGSLQALSGNYRFVVLNEEKFEIIPAPLHLVVVENQYKRFGAVDPALTYTAIGLQRGDFIINATTGSLVREVGEDLGFYGISQGSLTTRANYFVASFTGADFEIRQSQISGLSLPSQTHVYDGQVKALQVEGTILPEAVITYTNNNQTNVGIYQVTAVVDYGIDYEPLTLIGTLTITQAEQVIDFRTVTTVVIEDTPTLQLTATASSSLPVSYRIDNREEQQIAQVDASGLVRFLRTGTVTLTAFQLGNANYKAALPVARTIEVVSRDASISNLSIDGISYGKPEKEVYVIIGCDRVQEEVIIEVEVAEGAHVSPSDYLTVAVKEYGIYEQILTVISPNGTVTETYKVVIEKRIPTEKIVVQKYDNVLLVNNNKQTNGGYVFQAYQWFKNGEPIGDKQAYSAGDAFGTTLEAGAEYYVELTLYNGKKITSCPIFIQDKAPANWGVYPNPVKKNQLLHIRLDEDKQQATSYVIYNVKGQTIKRGEFVEGNTNKSIEIPTTVASGSYFLVLKVDGKQQSVQFIVKE